MSIINICSEFVTSKSGHLAQSRECCPMHIYVSKVCILRVQCNVSEFPHLMWAAFNVNDLVAIGLQWHHTHTHTKLHHLIISTMNISVYAILSHNVTSWRHQVHHWSSCIRGFIRTPGMPDTRTFAHIAQFEKLSRARISVPMTFPYWARCNVLLLVVYRKTFWLLRYSITLIGLPQQSDSVPLKLLFRIANTQSRRVSHTHTHTHAYTHFQLSIWPCNRSYLSFVCFQWDSNSNTNATDWCYQRMLLLLKKRLLG